MQENDIIYEITKQIKNKDNFKNDIQEAFSLVNELFQKKYISKLKDEVNKQIKLIQKSPTKEITLLQSIKPFIEKNSHKNIDTIISTLNNINVINSIKNKANLISDETNIDDKIVYTNSVNKNNMLIDDSIKDDGIYDIDENCLLSIQNNNIIKNSNCLLIIILILIFFNMK